MEGPREPLENVSDNPKKMNSVKLDRFFGIVALILLAVAWISGGLRSESELTPFLRQALPDAGFFEPVGGDVYKGWDSSAKERIIGYLAIGKGQGYGGTMKVAVAVDETARVLNAVIINHKETAAYLARLRRKGLPDTLRGKEYTEEFKPGLDVDAISGATLSMEAVASGVRNAVRMVAVRALNMDPIPESKVYIHIGLPELVLIALFLFGFLGRSRLFKSKKTIRWMSMGAGLLILGFVFNKPLTLVHINRILLGYWPLWQHHLYWYILVGGVLFLAVFFGTGPYCEWMCPFGAAQEGLAAIGGAGVRVRGRVHLLLRWMQRLLALGAVGLAIFFRNPSISSYEVFGALFHLVGSSFIFGLLGIVLIASLFIRRPWCLYLCPIRPVTEYVRMMTRWGRG
jgi:NosR/NirI family nitrous oxide reductase transcriptional regulator